MEKYKLDEEQLKMLANITAGMGHAFFAGSIIPFIMGLASPSPIVILLLILDSIACWILAILFSERKKK